MEFSRNFMFRSFENFIHSFKGSRRKETLPSDAHERNHCTRQVTVDPLNHRPINQCKSTFNNLDATLNKLRYSSIALK